MYLLNLRSSRHTTTFLSHLQYTLSSSSQRGAAAAASEKYLRLLSNVWTGVDIFSEDISLSWLSFATIAELPLLGSLMLPLSGEKSTPKPPASWIRWVCFVVLIVFSYATLPKVLWRPDVSPSVQSVWYFGWLTALSTGIGPLPFFFMDKPSQILLGAANAVAAGMMMSASVGLSVQGCRSGPGGGFTIEAAVRTFIGALSGWFFIRIAKKCLEKRDEAMSFADIRSFSVRKVLLVVFVMTLHSFSEGVGIGVSFAGDSGSAMGLFISVSLAVHNVPEGLAVALVMVPGGASTVDTVLWAIFTSLPQPIMAVPAFLFVETFEPFLPVGLGFAAGAMLFVAVFELFPDALKDLSLPLSAAVTTFAFGLMGLFQWSIHDGVY
jgi:ZIP family zinc transporter